MSFSLVGKLEILFGGCFPSREHLTFYLHFWRALSYFKLGKGRGQQGWWELQFPWAQPELGDYYWPEEQHRDGDSQQCLVFHSKREKKKKNWGKQETGEGDGILSPATQIKMFIRQQVSSGHDECIRAACAAQRSNKVISSAFKMYEAERS